jgi:hypothetical protein
VPRVGAPRIPDLRTPPLVGVVVAIAAWVLIAAFAEPWGRLWGTGQDARCYWVPTYAAPYALSDWTQPIAYVYSPAFLQALYPLKLLAWGPFVAAWTAILLLAVRYLSGPRLYAAAIVFAAMELAGGNTHLLVAAAVVAGFRWPAAWAFILLTKITPGIGLLWFAVRREWRSLAIALGATALVVAVSAAIDPHAWADWLGVVEASAGKTNGTWAAVPIPLWLRLPVAAAIVVWGARSDRRWAVPVAAMLALPALWYGGLSILLAVIPLRDRPLRPGKADPGAPAGPPGPAAAPADPAAARGPAAAPGVPGAA